MKGAEYQMMKKAMKIVLPVLIVLGLIAGALWVGTFGVGQTDSPSAQETSMKLAYDGEMVESAAMDYGASASTSMASGAANDAIAAQDNRKLVRTADLTIRTRAFAETSQKVQSTLTEMGGYVESLYEHGETGSRRLSLYMRVPSEKLDDFLLALEGAGRVTDRSESTTDMTTQYQDNDARLATLYAKRDRLNELLLKAEDVSDLIEIESAIADTQYQIDRYETSQRDIDRQVDMSAVSLSLIEEKPADIAQADLTLGERIRAGFAASIEWLGEFSRDLVVFLVVISPVAVPVAAVCILIHIIRKRKGK